MCALGRDSWVQTPLPPDFYQIFSPHAGAFSRNAPSKEHQSRYITLFFKGTYGVIGFFELMVMSLAGLMHFLSYLWGRLSRFPWPNGLDQLVLRGGVRKSHCHVFLGGLDPGQAPPKSLVLMLRLT